MFDVSVVVGSQCVVCSAVKYFLARARVGRKSTGETVDERSH